MTASFPSTPMRCDQNPPKEDEQVFVYLFGDSPYIAWMNDGKWYTDDFEVDPEEEPTVWWPLPKPYEKG